MKRMILVTLLLSIFVGGGIATAALTYDEIYYMQHLGYLHSGSSVTDPMYLFMNEIIGYVEGSNAQSSLYFSPTDTAPTAAEGVVYWSDADNGLKICSDGTNFIDVDVSGASSLATAYTAGSKILAPTLEVEIEVADSSDNPALRLDFDDATTNAQDVLVIDNAGDDGAAVSIQINGTAGLDIQGTSDTWNVSYLGVGTHVGLIVGATDIVLENSGKIENSTDTEILIAENSEDFIWDFTTDGVTIKSSTGVVAVDWGDVDSHTGLNAIAFDAAVANTITQTGSGDTDDLTISQAGTVDCSLILQSAGSITDALSLITSDALGVIKISSSDVLDIDAVDDIDIDTSDGTYTLTIGGSSDGDYVCTVADNMSMVAVGTMLLQNTEAASDITINSVLGTIIIEAEEDAANAIYIIADASTASTIEIFNDTGTSVTEGAASIQLLSDVGGIELKSTANLAKAVNIMVDNSTTSSIMIFNDTGTSVTECAASIQLWSDAGGVQLQSDAALAEAICLRTDGGTAETIYIHADQGTGCSATTETDASIQLISDDGGIGLYSNANLADAIRIEAVGGTTTSISIQATKGSIAIEAEEDAANAILITADGSTLTTMKLHNDTGTDDASIYLASDVGGITLNAAAGSIDVEAVGADAGDIILNSGDDMTFTVAGDLVFAVTGAITLPDDVIRKTTVAVTAVQADNLRATPKELVAAEAGKMHEFVKVIVAIDYGATAFTESDDNLAVRYENTTGVIVSDVIEATGLADATADTVCFAGPAPTTSALVTEANSTNKALVLHGTGNGEWGNSGDSPLVIITYYRTHTTAELGL